MIRGDGVWRRKSKPTSEIPSASLADMAFLLLIFFMVSTTFPKERPRQLDFPDAEGTQKLTDARRDILHVYLEQDGQVYINDALVPMERVAAVVAPLQKASGERLVTLLKGDRDVPYHFVHQLQEELQKAGALRVTFYTHREAREKN
jgi:biopolymer transport protein ExbD